MKPKQPRAAPPRRIKVTSPAPQICSTCWWEQRVKKLAEQNKRLRLDAIKHMRGMRNGKTSERERRDEEARDEIPDAVDMMTISGVL